MKSNEIYIDVVEVIQQLIGKIFFTKIEK